MAIPGCALLFIHCASLGYTLSSFRVGISNYLVFEVGTFAFDYCRENEHVTSKAQSCGAVLHFQRGLLLNLLITLFRPNVIVFFLLECGLTGFAKLLSI